jgi:hypothetical protein
VVNATAITGTWAFTVQGSNDNITFEDASSLTADTVSEQTTTFPSQYKYWRYKLDQTSAGGTDSVTFSAYLVEDVWDRLIIYKTFELIFSDFRKAQNDSWDLLVQSYLRKYESELNAIKFLYDSDDSGAVTDGEISKTTYILTL